MENCRDPLLRYCLLLNLYLFCVAEHTSIVEWWIMKKFTLSFSTNLSAWFLELLSLLDWVIKGSFTNYGKHWSFLVAVFKDCAILLKLSLLCLVWLSTGYQGWKGLCLIIFLLVQKVECQKSISSMLSTKRQWDLSGCQDSYKLTYYSGSPHICTVILYLPPWLVVAGVYEASFIFWPTIRQWLALLWYRQKYLFEVLT